MATKSVWSWWTVLRWCSCPSIPITVTNNALLGSTVLMTRTFVTRPIWKNSETNQRKSETLLARWWTYRRDPWQGRGGHHQVGQTLPHHCGPSHGTHTCVLAPAPSLPARACLHQCGHMAPSDLRWNNNYLSHSYSGTPFKPFINNRLLDLCIPLQNSTWECNKYLWWHPSSPPRSHRWAGHHHPWASPTWVCSLPCGHRTPPRGPGVWLGGLPEKNYRKMLKRLMMGLHLSNDESR